MARWRVRDEKLLKNAPRNPEGGWLPPDPKELQKFFDRISEEAVKLFGVDEDGDACVLIRIMDNSREESSILNYEPIPRDIEESPYHPYGKKKWTEGRRDPDTKKYIYPVHTEKEEEARTKALLENKFWRNRMIGLNFTLAHNEIEHMMRMNEHDLRDVIEAPEKKRAARLKELEALQEKFADIFAHYEGRGYAIDREARTYWWKDEDRSGEDKRLQRLSQRHKMSEKPEDFDELMKELKVLKAYKPAKEVKF